MSVCHKSQQSLSQGKVLHCYSLVRPIRRPAPFCVPKASLQLHMTAAFNPPAWSLLPVFRRGAGRQRNDTLNSLSERLGHLVQTARETVNVERLLQHLLKGVVDVHLLGGLGGDRGSTGRQPGGRGRRRSVDR